METMEKAQALKWRTKTRVEKWAQSDVDKVAALSGMENPDGDMMASYGFTPEVVEDNDSNLVTTAGLGRITALIIGAAGQALTATAVRLGVGNSNTAAAVGQTDLQAAAGAGNRQFYIMDATYPQQAAGVMTFRATFATGDANFVWNEWCLDVGTPTVANGTTVNAVMVNRKVASLGTKVSGAWTLTVTITLA